MEKIEKKKTISFFYPPGQDTFLRDIINGLYDEYEINEFTGGDDQHFFRTVQGSDYCWFEWGSDIVRQVSMSPAYSKYIVRIHSYELFEGFQHNVNWEKIAKLILVNDSCKSLFRDGISGAIGGVPVNEEIAQKLGAPYVGSAYLHMPENRVQVIYHGVKTDKYTIPENKKFGKKIAFVGYINYKKGPELLLHTFEAIHRFDPTYEFHIAGNFQDLRELLYFNNLLPQLPFKVHIDGWVDDVNAYLADKDFVISTSLYESFQYSVIEGMCCGCIPLVHNWFGAGNVYPSKYLWNTIPECIEILRQFAEKTDEDKAMERSFNREYVKSMFSFERQMKEIKEMLRKL